MKKESNDLGSKSLEPTKAMNHEQRIELGKKVAQFSNQLRYAEFTVYTDFLKDQEFQPLVVIIELGEPFYMKGQASISFPDNLESCIFDVIKGLDQAIVREMHKFMTEQRKKKSNLMVIDQGQQVKIIEPKDLTGLEVQPLVVPKRPPLTLR